MTFNRHGSFYLRNSWAMKGLNAIDEEPTIFTPQNELLAVDTLGLGRVMVTSLRYWMSAIGLTKEDKDSAGRVVLELTPLGERIKKNDKFFQCIGTAWLLHRNLARNKEGATTWYWFFNVFDKPTFTEKELLEELKAYVRLEGKSVADSSLKRDFDCLRNTYEKEELEDISSYIEEGIISYFSKLNLIGKIGKGTYKKLPPADSELSAETLLYSILDDNPNHSQVRINDLYEKEGHIGKIYSLSWPLLMLKLEELQRKDYIKIYNRFGHNHIEIKTRNKEKVLGDYYRKEM